MNREIKFRGLHKDGTWLIGYFTTYDDVCYIKAIDRDQRFGCGIPVIPETVGQFTGLHDKNDIEIYEGDILLPNYNGFQPFEVKFKDGAFNCCRFDISQCSVKGNVHENPELLCN